MSLSPAEAATCSAAHPTGTSTSLPAIHSRLVVPVELTLEVLPDAGLFCHEERPAGLAAALLPVLTAATRR